MKEDLKKAASANAAEQDLDAFKTRVFGIKTASDRWMRSKVEAFRKEGLGLLTHWLTYGALNGKWKSRTFFQTWGADPSLFRKRPVSLNAALSGPDGKGKFSSYSVFCTSFLWRLADSQVSTAVTGSRLWQFMFWDRGSCYINDRVPPPFTDLLKKEIYGLRWGVVMTGILLYTIQVFERSDFSSEVVEDRPPVTFGRRRRLLVSLDTDNAQRIYPGIVPSPLVNNLTLRA